MGKIVETVTPFTVAAEKLRRMVSLSPEFQRQCGVDNPVAAAQRVHLQGRDEDGEIPLRPFGLIWPTQFQLAQYSSGSRNWLSPKGAVELYVNLNVPEELRADEQGAALNACEFFGRLMVEVGERSGADDPDSGDGTGHLSIIDMRLRNLFISEREHWDTDVGMFHACEIEVSWTGGAV